MMYKQPHYRRSGLTRTVTRTGHPIERKVELMIENGEPIEQGGGLIYTPREDGVLPGYNMRTDRWDEALKATDKYNRSEIAKRAMTS